jgi:hypothetical protein
MGKALLAGLSLISFLAGCASEANYAKMLDTLVGSPEVALLDRWGVPTSTYQSGDVRYLAYRREQLHMLSGTQPTSHTTVIGDTAYTTVTGGRSAETYSTFCETTFKIRAGRVEGYSYRGSDCVAAN